MLSARAPPTPSHMLILPDLAWQHQTCGLARYGSQKAIRLEMFKQLVEEVMGHDAVDSYADPEEARYDRDRVIGALAEMSTLLEHIGGVVRT